MKTIKIIMDNTNNPVVATVDEPKHFDGFNWFNFKRGDSVFANDGEYYFVNEDDDCSYLSIHRI